MTPDAHRAYTSRLLDRLAADADVLGVVTLGSTSGLPPLPDQFSDHDFFVVTRPGAQERFRADLGWLPEAAEVVLTLRDTPHGGKALYPDGHLAEFAVFDLEELTLARVNRYAVPLDRADVTARLQRVRQASAPPVAPDRDQDDRRQAGLLLSCLVIGAGRYGRGERLSGHWLVRVGALGHLVAILRSRLAGAALGQLDDLDPYRRLEVALPAVAAELDGALRLPLPAGARALLAILARERPELMAPAARLAAERVLKRAEAAGAPR